MELEIRNNKGVLFSKIKNKLALHYYKLLSESIFFKKEVKKIEDKGSFSCFICTDLCKIVFTEDLEILFDEGDYIKIII